jgi:hypothetical protein
MGWLAFTIYRDISGVLGAACFAARILGSFGSVPLAIPR